MFAFGSMMGEGKESEEHEWPMAAKDASANACVGELELGRQRGNGARRKKREILPVPNA